MLAPIVLFVYNRPDHTQKVLDALKNNPEAKDSELFVYSDGAKENTTESEMEHIEETRQVIKSLVGFKSVTLIESNVNKGLANSIIEGVTEIVNKYGRIIVLEDDIVTSSGFLKYMNDALEVYSNIKKVMHISAYVFPFNDTKKKYVFFSKPTTCWGWATWKDSWKHFEKNVDKQIDLLEKSNNWDEFTLKNTIPSYKHQLFQNKDGYINTWAIFWYASVFLMNGTSLHPSISLVNNIGLDGSGENSGEWSKKNPFYWDKLADSIPVCKKRSFNSKNENILLRNAYREKILGNLFKEKNYTLRDRLYLLRKKFFN
jgi:GR25 family glycosyltransferase involved in LPS biosynthesis